MNANQGIPDCPLHDYNMMVTREEKEMEDAEERVSNE
jgi:hypothetical protein